MSQSKPETTVTKIDIAFGSLIAANGVMAAIEAIRGILWILLWVLPINLGAIAFLGFLWVKIRRWKE